MKKTWGKYLWGIDLGGTKIEGLVLESVQNPVTKARLRIPTEKEKGYDHILSQIKKVLEMIEEEVGEKADKVGIGTPGTLDPPTQTMKNCNSVVLNGQPLLKDLTELLGIPVSMANDANCFALAEARMGVVPDECPQAKVVFGVIMGTGVGGGMVVNQRIINGLQGIGGEWGHNFLDESGGKDYAGLDGCVETILSGPALQGYYENISGNKKTLKEIYDLHLAGSDPQATQTMRRLTTFFGKAIAVIINILDPDAIVLGGGVGNIDLLYTEGVEETRKHVFNNRLETKILKPKLGDSAGVFGAAFLTV